MGLEPAFFAEGMPAPSDYIVQVSIPAFHPSIVGSVVECSPATRAARVRFPDDAISFYNVQENNPYIDWNHFCK